ncbi:MAG: ribosome maturation factor RimM [Pseudomonadota bacterium]|nr:ribosome maturation factor RimM [Pseudomonadota bacterium]
MTQQPDWSATHVVMGRIGAPYGIKGWVKLISFTDPADNLLDYSQFWIADGAALREIEIDEARPQGDALVGHIKGCDVREETRLYTGLDLLVPKADLPELDEGWYWHELEGLRVVNLDGEDLGVVDHLLATGANDVLVVRGDEASIDRTERLLPYVEEQVVKEVDLDAGLIRVDWGRDW